MHLDVNSKVCSQKVASMAGRRQLELDCEGPRAKHGRAHTPPPRRRGAEGIFSPCAPCTGRSGPVLNTDSSLSPGVSAPLLSIYWTSKRGFTEKQTWTNLGIILTTGASLGQVSSCATTGPALGHLRKCSGGGGPGTQPWSSRSAPLREQLRWPGCGLAASQSRLCPWGRRASVREQPPLSPEKVPQNPLCEHLLPFRVAGQDLWSHVYDRPPVVDCRLLWTRSGKGLKQ